MLVAKQWSSFCELILVKLVLELSFHQRPHALSLCMWGQCENSAPGCGEEELVGMAQGMHFDIAECTQDMTSPFHFCVRYPGTSNLSDWHVFQSITYGSYHSKNSRVISYITDSHSRVNIRFYWNRGLRQFHFSKEILHSLEISSEIPIWALLPQHLIFL